MELLLREVGEQLGSLRELADMDFFSVGDRYSFEQLIGEEEIWSTLSQDELKGCFSGISDQLGVDITNIHEGDVVRREFQEGIKGEKTEEGAHVTVL